MWHWICKLKWIFLQHPTYHPCRHSLIHTCGPFRVANYPHVSWACWNNLKYLVGTSTISTKQPGPTHANVRKKKIPATKNNEGLFFSNTFLGDIFSSCSFNFICSTFESTTRDTSHKHQAGVKAHAVNRCPGFDLGRERQEGAGPPQAFLRGSFLSGEINLLCLLVSQTPL